MSTCFEKKGLFTTAAVDNIDHNPSSTTAKTSFHGTGISIFQHPSDDISGIERGELILGNRSNSRQVSSLPDTYANIGAEGGSELLQDNLEECIATPIPSTSNKMKEQSNEHQEFEIKNHGLQMPIMFGKKNTYGNAAEKGIKLWTDFQIKTAI
ncbi:Hypothetical predicted protein, partial [Mytilus galloprovincialis]